MAIYAGYRTYQKNQFLSKDSPPHSLQNKTEKNTEKNDVNVTKIEKKINQNITISSISLGLATIGTLVYPPLSIFSVPVIVWISVPIFKRAYHSIFKEKQVNMFVIDTVFLTGTLVTNNYFAGNLAIFAFSLSQKILYKTEDHSKQSLINIFNVQCHSVWLWKENIEIEIPFEKLNGGDIIILNAGETIPVDGIIMAGIASVDQHMLTGESQVVETESGDQVFASTVILAGKIYVQVEKAGPETVAAQIGQILVHTADFKKSLQSRGERIADESALPTLVISALTLPILGSSRAVTMANSCFGLYIRVLGPLSMLTYLNKASQNGILIKDGRSLELLKEVNAVVFDKTGTLTREQPYIGKIYTCNGFSENELLTFAGAAEHRQSHPIAKAILQATMDRELKLPTIEEAKYEVSYGIRVNIFDSRDTTASSRIIRVGSARFMEFESISIPIEIEAIQKHGNEQGYSFVYVAVDTQLAGIIELHPTIRPEAKHIISQLQQRGILTYIISGDHVQPTKRLAEKLGIDHYFAETLPQNKALIVEQLQKEGKFVCFVGDGINDSIALKQANVSISLNGASTIATDTAQIVLMEPDLSKLIQAINIASSFDTNMKINTLTSIVPGITTVVGVLFMNFTITYSVILNQMGLVVGVINSTLPQIKSQDEKIVS